MLIWRTLLCTLLACGLFAQGAADWKIAVKAPEKLKAGHDMPFEVRLTDAKGAPVAGADVELVLTMIDMDHGEQKKQAKESKPGIYSGTQQFLMVGGWNLEVRARKGSASTKQSFRYEVKE
ncbi:MAG: FixH family protein [Bryobacteraceae bacterium]